jgi:hypothetical protein
MPRFGHARPRIGPPLPAKSAVADFTQLAQTLGISLFPWQRTAARYLTASAQRGWLYREVAIIVARQNGKTTLLVPLIIHRLLSGQRVMHTAQNRELPREVFGEVAELLVKHYKSLLVGRGPRFGSGQEEVRLLNGGHYRIVAPSRGGARGPSRDLVIVDELREMENEEFIAAAKPTLLASPRPQMVYLSNAGTDESVVLNKLRLRAATDPGLAYLEWSAAPARDADDREGWREANPAIGHMLGVLDNLQHEYRANLLGNSMAIFETEHLCRWASSLRSTAFRPSQWEKVRLPNPLQNVPEPFALGIGVAPGWERATVAVAALRADGRIGTEIYRELRENVTPQAVTAIVDEFTAKRWPQVIAYDAKSGGASEFQRHADETGWPYDALTPGAMVDATMDFTEMIMAGKLAVDDPLLDAQIPLVVKRDVGADGAYRFSRGDSLGPIDAVEAALLAAHAISFLALPGIH